MAEEPPTKRKCRGDDCENDAGSLQCPTCLKLGIKDSFFCSQDCFKKSWVSLVLEAHFPSMRGMAEAVMAHFSLSAC